MIIQGIDDVLPAVQGRGDFAVIEKDGYTAIDYLFQDKDTFDAPERLECRGIKFKSNGEILSRPFQKFFNVGEKEQVHEIDLSRPHKVLDKLDGSMIHAAEIDGSIVFMTRKGVTDVSERCQKRFNTARIIDFCAEWIGYGFTPIFEYTAPDNRIVIRYEEPALTLLAMRRTLDGTYNKAVFHAARVRGISVVGSPAFAYGDLSGLINHTRALEDAEGYVIRFDDGHMLKMKADDYVAKHRALGDMASRKKVLALVLQGFEDDVIPNLDADDADELRDFAANVNAEVSRTLASVEAVVTEAGQMDRKDFALSVAPNQPDWMKGLLFARLDGKDVNTMTRTLFQRRPELVSAPWRGITHDEAA